MFWCFTIDINECVVGANEEDPCGNQADTYCINTYSSSSCVSSLAVTEGIMYNLNTYCILTDVNRMSN